MKRTSGFLAASVAVLGLMASHNAVAQEMADTIYLGGPILTINDAAPRAEAVAVKDGLIVAAGSLDDVMALQKDGTQIFDLEGRAMLPGFVDSHGHAIMGGLQALSANLLSAPDGDVSDIASLQDTLRTWMADNEDGKTRILTSKSFGYDQSGMSVYR